MFYKKLNGLSHHGEKPTLVHINNPKEGTEPILSRQERKELLLNEKQTGQEHYHYNSRGEAVFDIKDRRRPRNEDEIEFV